MLVQVYMVSGPPMWECIERELDDAIERWLDGSGSQVVAVQILGECRARFGRAFENQQTSDVFGACLGFRDEKAKIE